MRCIALAAVFFVGCAAETPSPDPNPASGRFTFTGLPGDSQGLVLATSTVIDVASQQLGDADIYLSVKMVVQLRGPNLEGSFCSKGNVASLGDIEPGHASCEWTYAGISGYSPHDVSVAAGDGYLVRDRHDERLYRLRIVDDSVVDAATVVFDVEPIDSAR